ncbi:hypothetical protein Pmani_023712 [Petrolisthes manimaculis]|uniref:Uncharacterized protein n=1 Tax=Petrolisthes manimaculis TaxID=1843537 RepID=A0AAE1PB81_9EUCA|nr:hypothetical protein Pmani_023712 [Petrolisthes manimaculis]
MARRRLGSEGGGGRGHHCSPGRLQVTAGVTEGGARSSSRKSQALGHCGKDREEQYTCGWWVGGGRKHGKIGERRYEEKKKKG